MAFKSGKSPDQGSPLIPLLVRSQPKLSDRPKSVRNKMSAPLCRTMSLCSPASLFSLMEQGDLTAFREAVNTSNSNTWLQSQLYYILDIACQTDQTGDFVRELLNAGADPNKTNAARKMAPIHFAAKVGNLAALEALVNDPGTDINLPDGRGKTALHVLADQPYSSAVGACIKFLLKNSEFQVNRKDNYQQTAVYLAAKQGRAGKDTVRLLLESRRVSIDSDITIEKKTARDLILENMRELEPLFPNIVFDEKNDEPRSKLFRLLYEWKESEFLQVLSDLLQTVEKSELLNYNDGFWTLLQYAIHSKLLEVTKELLEKGANPNLIGPCQNELPAIMACRGGYFEIVKKFSEKEGTKFSSESNEKTALHSIIEEAENESNKDIYYKIFDEILTNLIIDGKIDVNATDHLNNTALHIAARYEDRHFILGLLNLGAYIGALDYTNESPLANISLEVLEEFLNNCLSMNNRLFRDENFEIIFNYKFLSPPEAFRDSSQDAVSLTLDDSSKESDIVKNFPGELVPECRPLLYISQTPDLRQLLKHPIFTSFLALKWRGIRPFFYINLIFYTIFVALMTTYILVLYEYGPNTDLLNINVSNIEGIPLKLEGNDFSKNNTNLTNNSGGTNESSEGSSCRWSPGDGIWTFLVFYLFCLFFRELFQLMVSPLHYIRSPENYLEILLIISSGLVLFYRCADVTTRPHLSAITILLSWAELVLLIGRHPQLSTNIEMLKTVSKNFLQFLAWYSILIIAFALSFYTLFRRKTEDDNFFLEPGTAFFKTVVMVTGEFDAGDLPFQYFPGTSHMVFVLFVFLVAIVLFNLLNGLAVSDTQAIKDDAELVGIVSRIKLISYTESVLLGHPFWCCRKVESDYCCCCFQALQWIRSLSFTRLSPCIDRVRLFPGIIPNRVIRVLPNQFSRVLTTLPKKDEVKSRRNDDCYNNSYCYDGYRLDSKIVNEAVDILKHRNHPSESQRIQDLEKKINLIEKYCKNTQNGLEAILKMLQENH